MIIRGQLSGDLCHAREEMIAPTIRHEGCCEPFTTPEYLRNTPELGMGNPA
jgi:hypothetical protein